MENEAKQRLKLKRLVQRADRNPANWNVAIETAEEIRLICDQAGLLMKQGDNENAFKLLWLIAEELMPHYEILEETVQVYESLEDWAYSVAAVVEELSFPDEKLKQLHTQLQSTDYESYTLQEPLKPLLQVVSHNQ